MASLCNQIEDYLKRLLAISPRRHIDIQRRELANKFGCVPSQINYVLKTRFSLDRGYLVESRRGGRGFIRIFRVDPLKMAVWEETLSAQGGEQLDRRSAADVLMRLHEEKFVSRREAELMESLLEEKLYLPLTDPDIIRQLQGKLFGAILKVILKE